MSLDFIIPHMIKSNGYPENVRYGLKTEEDLFEMFGVMALAHKDPRLLDRLNKQRLGTIIEHREEGPVVGHLVYGDVNGGGRSVGIGWEDDGLPRTTLFYASSWECKVVDNVIFLNRTSPDTIVVNVPWPNTDKYTIVLHA